MRDVLVLAYHAVSPDWQAPLSVLPERFEAQIKMLSSRGYRGATVHDAVHNAPEGRTIAVTFDDGYRSVLDLAFPILQSVGFPGTVFVSTDFAAESRAMWWPGIEHWLGGPHEDELRSLSWSDLGLLADAGWEIGAHTRSHPDLTRASDEELERELRGSRECCERELQRPCRSLAYPFGRVDARVREAARVAGFTAACTVPDRLTARDPLCWPRVGIWHSDGPLAVRVKVSPTMRRIRSTTAAEALLPAFRWILLQRRARRARHSQQPGGFEQAAPGSES